MDDTEATKTTAKSDAALPVKPLGYEVAPDHTTAWTTVVRWTCVATAALAAAYFLNGVAIGVRYVLVGRYGYIEYFGVYLFGVLAWPLYLLPLVAGLLCLRQRRAQHWAMLKWGLVVMMGVRALVALSNVAVGLLAATPAAAGGTANAAEAAMIASYFFNGVTDVVPPAAMLWLATRPAFRDAFRG